MKGLITTVLLFSMCISTPAEDNSPSLDIWYGPASLDTVTRGVRDDFIDQVTDTNNWPTVYGQTKVFKQFIEPLYPSPRPMTGRPPYTDEELERLASFINEAGLKTAFEIGALRWNLDRYGPGSGKEYAEEEIKVLQRWVDAGGNIDYLSTDHAVMWNVGMVLQRDRVLKGLADSDWRKIMDEVVESLAMMQEAFPDARIGMIESLGYFSVEGIDGTMYHTTDPSRLYRVDLEEFISTAQKKLEERGIELDHFHIDFSYQDCLHDGRGTGELDYNRILGAEKLIKTFGIDSGIIINAFDDFSYTGINIVQEEERAPNIDERNESAVENTLRYFNGYIEAGGDPDTWIFQRWQPYPHLTGPETVLETDMGLTRVMLEKLLNR